MPVPRPIFKRHNEHVAVVDFRMGDQDIKAGEPFNRDKYRTHIIRYMFMRRRIGPVGHPWTEEMLAGVKKPETVSKEKAKVQKAQAKKKAELKEKTTKKAESKAEDKKEEKSQ